MKELMDWIRPSVASVVSVIGAVTGTTTSVALPLSTVNTGFQHAAWTVAIMAGLFSIANYIRNWMRTDNVYRKRQRK